MKREKVTICHDVAGKIIGWCSDILEINKQERIVYQYGLEVVLELVWKIIGLIMFAIFSGTGIIFLLSIGIFAFLRAFAGGRHCSKSLSCFLSMTVIGLLPEIVSKQVLIDREVGMMLLVIYLVMVYKWAPYCTLNSTKTQKEQNRNKNISCGIIAVYLILYLIIGGNPVRSTIVIASGIEVLSIAPKRKEKENENGNDEKKNCKFYYKSC